MQVQRSPSKAVAVLLAKFGESGPSWRCDEETALRSITEAVLKRSGAWLDCPYKGQRRDNNTAGSCDRKSGWKKWGGVG